MPLPRWMLLEGLFLEYFGGLFFGELPGEREDGGNRHGGHRRADRGIACELVNSETESPRDEVPHWERAFHDIVGNDEDGCHRREDGSDEIEKVRVAVDDS